VKNGNVDEKSASEGGTKDPKFGIGLESLGAEGQSSNDTDNSKEEDHEKDFKNGGNCFFFHFRKVEFGEKIM
jgi:hypothetical protein